MDPAAFVVRITEGRRAQNQETIPIKRKNCHAEEGKPHHSRALVCIEKDLLHIMQDRCQQQNLLFRRNAHCSRSQRSSNCFHWLDPRQAELRQRNKHIFLPELGRQHHRNSTWFAPIEKQCEVKQLRRIGTTSITYPCRLCHNQRW